MTKPEGKPRLGSRRALIQAREKLGMTRVELAAELGIDRTVIYKVEVGIQDTTVGLMRRWADALGGASFDLFKPPNRNKPRNAPVAAAEQPQETAA
jgi:DNA-binding XRE family transcriptional regulator